MLGLSSVLPFEIDSRGGVPHPNPLSGSRTFDLKDFHCTYLMNLLS